MFKRCVIEFKAPLCNCPKINYGTSIDSVKETVIAKCKDCHTELVMPFAKFGITYSVPKDDKEEEFDVEGQKFYAIEESKK